MTFDLQLPSEKITRQQAQQLSDLFGLGNVEQVYGLIGGLRGRAYFIGAEQGCFVFKTYGIDFPRQQLEVIVQVLRFLERYDLRVPRIFSMKNGSYILCYQGPRQEEKGMMLTFAPGRCLSEEELGRCSFRRAADEVLKLHCALSDSPDFGFRRNKSNLDTFESVLAEIGNLFEELGAEKLLRLNGSREILDEVKIYYIAGRKQLRSIGIKSQEQPVHGDLWSTNFIFEDGRLTALVDFDHVAHGCIEDDWAMFLSEWMCSGRGEKSWNDYFELVQEVLSKSNYKLQRLDVRLRSLLCLLRMQVGFLRSIVRENNEDALKWAFGWYNERVRRVESLLRND